MEAYQFENLDRVNEYLKVRFNFTTADMTPTRNASGKCFARDVNNLTVVVTPEKDVTHGAALHIFDEND